jgi:hypothetical protein
MAYRLRYEAEAKAEIQEAKDTYPGSFAAAVNAWLLLLAAEAEGGTYPLSLDAEDWLEAAEGAIESRRHLWNKFWEVGSRDKVRALIAFVKKRRPPWELRTATKPFTIPGDSCHEVTAVYEVNHVEKEIRFRMFVGLPAQG